MVNTSKVLTVSYGTFSCTLEGFDDSFETMKAIAEYFRDLAADDRYFGAEPPTPDAEMLARIAEREITRRVAAHEENGGIVLRAEEPGAAEPAQIETPVEDAPEAPAAKAAPAAAALVAPVHAPDTPVDFAQMAAEAEAKADAEMLLEDVAPEADVESAGEERPSSIASEAFDPEAELWSEEMDGDSAGEDTVAARLDGIRSVVNRWNTSFGDDDYSEDEHAMDLVRGASEKGETPAQATGDKAAEDKAAEEKGGDEAGEDEDIFADLAEQLARDAAPEEGEAQADAPHEAATEDAAEDTYAEDDGDEDALEDTLSQLLADAMPSESDEAQDGAPAEKPAPFILGEELKVTDEAAPGEGDALSGEIEEPAPEDRPLRARVVKMKRSEFEAAIAGGALIEEDDETLIADPEAGILAPDAEDELQRELAAVEAEMTDPAPDAAPDGVQNTPADVAEDVAEEDAAAPARPQEAEPDVSRVFDETDTQFEKPDSTNRRSAIKHLRAAVMATRAEKEEGGAEEEDPKRDYQADLDEVVRPRRPSARADQAEPRSASARPSQDKPVPPLRLVAEQRVDEEDAAPADTSAETPEPVQPRRVSAPELAGEAQAESGFTAFAEALGTNSLTDLLEAAAAYMAEVEGQDQFSRPMLMGKIREATEKSGTAFTREDGLRSFGQLLRDGKLRKIKGGRFAVTEATEFREDARQAG
jgi:pilus assembly protein FimV